MIPEQTIFTIGRQVGSGGRLIGKIIADRLGIPFYDKEIIKRTAEESGIRDEFFEKHDERNTFMTRLSSFFRTADTFAGETGYLSAEGLFKLQSEVMRKIAKEGPCVIVGRCSDYILRDFENRIDVFITGDWKDRTERAAKYDTISVADAERRIRDLEDARSDYYNFFTNKTWGRAESYHMCINSSHLTLEECADMIIDYVKRM